MVVREPHARRCSKVGEGSRRSQRGRQIPRDEDRVTPGVHRRVGREAVSVKTPDPCPSTVAEPRVRFDMSPPRYGPRRRGDERPDQEVWAGEVANLPEAAACGGKPRPSVVIKPNVREEIANRRIDEEKVIRHGREGGREEGKTKVLKAQTLSQNDSERDNDPPPKRGEGGYWGGPGAFLGRL